MSVLVARLLVFFTSAAVLVIEVLAQRLLAPYLGVSLEVFTGVIGVILAGISLGAWLGGRAADRHDPAALLGPLLVVGGLTGLISPLLVDLVGPVVRGGGPAAIVSTTLVAFFAPAAVLSAVPPLVVKLRLASLDRTGRVVGALSAVGTAGAIFGTFAAGFVLLASFPTRPIVISVGGALIVAGLVLTGARRRLLATIAAGLVLTGGLVAYGGPCDFETTYHCAEIVTDEDRPGGRTLVLDGVRNSYVDIDDPTHLEFRYAQVMADVIDTQLPEGPLQVVSIGGGGFTFPGYLATTRPGTEHVVLEIDGKLVEIGRRLLGFEDTAQVIVDDARLSLGDLDQGTADLVIGDAFSGLSVPWHLTTVEFVREVAGLLRPGGIYTMNVIDYGDIDFVRSEAATLDAVFAHGAVIAPPEYLAGETGGNFVLVASAAPIEVDMLETAIASRGGVEAVVTDLRAFAAGAAPLSDDFAPVDQMIDRS